MATQPLLTHAEEKSLVASMTRPVSRLLLGLIVALPALYAMLAALALVGILPLWSVTLPLAYLAYSHYLLVHESAHGNIVRTGRWRAPVHGVAGWIGSLALGYTWPVLRRTHLAHHRHVNTPHDPDMYVEGSLRQLIATWLVMSFTDLIPLAISSRIIRHYRQVDALLIRRERMWVAGGQSLLLAIFAIAVHLGLALEWLLLMYLPQRLGVLILHVFLQWAPHAPFETDGKYTRTRIVRWPTRGRAIVENTHLLHHLWPQVPFHRLDELHARLRTTLEVRGVRVEGLFEHPIPRGSSPHGPARLFRLNPSTPSVEVPLTDSSRAAIPKS